MKGEATLDVEGKQEVFGTCRRDSPLFRWLSSSRLLSYTLAQLEIGLIREDMLVNHAIPYPQPNQPFLLRFLGR